MSFLEIILLAGWLIPVVFIGASAIYVTTFLERKQSVRRTHLNSPAAISGFSRPSSTHPVVSQRAA